jgi:hypothetical protein
MTLNFQQALDPIKLKDKSDPFKKIGNFGIKLYLIAQQQNSLIKFYEK